MQPPTFLGGISLEMIDISVILGIFKVKAHSSNRYRIVASVIAYNIAKVL
jgi:hypothetical protein